MKRVEAIKKTFASIRWVLARYQVGVIYKKQTEIMLDYFSCLALMLGSKQEKELFAEEVSKIQEYFRVFADRETYLAFLALSKKSESLEKSNIRKMFKRFSVSYFSDIINVMIEEVNVFLDKERGAKNSLFYFRSPEEQSY